MLKGWKEYNQFKTPGRQFGEWQKVKEKSLASDGGFLFISLWGRKVNISQRLLCVGGRALYRQAGAWGGGVLPALMVSCVDYVQLMVKLSRWG